MSRTRVYIGGSVRDAGGVEATPGAVAMSGGRVVDAGEVGAVVASAGPGAELVERPGALLLPGLVNAHTHLDLTDVGARAYGGDFIGWVRMVMEASRGAGYDRGTAAKRGAAMSRAAGVLTVGDIAGSPESTAALVGSGLRGVSFIEQFGIGIDFVTDDAVGQTLERWEEAEETGGVRIGLQPHAPYSAGPELYEIAGRFNVDYHTPIATHLAETMEELEFVAHATGPFRELLESMGKWKASFEGLYNEGLHPVNWLLRTDELEDPAGWRPRWLCAHCNYVGDEQIDRLAAFDASVVYCPRASEYFAHYEHRYHDMIDAGVNVALGTDSIVCHGSLSVLDEMRYLFGRDRCDPLMLLEMATVNGMAAMGLDGDGATFAEGARPGLIAVGYDGRTNTEPLRAVLGASEGPSVEVLEDAG